MHRHLLTPGRLAFAITRLVYYIPKAALGTNCFRVPVLQLLIDLCLCLRRPRLAALISGRDQGSEDLRGHFKRLGLRSLADDLNALDGIALLDGVDHAEAFGNLAEDGVLAIEPRGCHMGYEELAPIGARTRVCHREDARPIVGKALIDLIGEGIAGSAGPGPLGAAPLDHEVLDDPVEDQIVVEGLVFAIHIQRTLGKADKVGHGHRGLLILQGKEDLAFTGIKEGPQAVP